MNDSLKARSLRLDDLLRSRSRRSTRNEGSTKDEQVYERIFSAIIAHRLRPGDRLPEDALAETFEVSRTVIRKVLQRLAHERLVNIQAKRGAMVSKPTVEEARNVFAARRLIETGVMDQVVDRLTPAALEELRELTRAEDRALEAGNQRLALQLSGEFHQRLLDVAGNEELSTFLAQLLSRSSLIIAVYGPGWKGASHCESHTVLLNELEAGNVDALRQTMGEHLDELEAALNMEAVDTDLPDFKRIFNGILD
ncbi:GntR family transcriptional regulator [Crenobacter sp. SG2305]|uniref:GntR family transcriptional regulator n=1 Tax=Crenobacter oryzisoli TaxID=3056844 RepID=UPI0025AABA91|nr:GntR family transcriptional regulator [Crenobacter sp. SG2305]MDN0081732.1 GntR family transcriptional regulator [Crenobacter sp. SG2305]